MSSRLLKTVCGQLGHTAFCVSVLAALLFAAGASAQTVTAANSVDEQFATFHAQLKGAADRLLVDSAQLTRPANVVRVEPAQVSRATHRGSSNAAPLRVQQLRPLLEPILREEDVPGDLLAVVLVESGGRPAALSAKGALGLWQLMPQTARRYGLTVTPGKDERLDVLKATRAAARYLHDLYGQFGDWKLVLAAYDAGEQNIERAVNRVGSREFAEISWLLPAETRNYVPAVLAALRLFGDAEPVRVSGPTQYATPLPLDRISGRYTP